MRFQIEKKMLEKKIGSDLRERERVSEEGDRGEGAKGEISHTILESHVEGDRLSVKSWSSAGQRTQRKREKKSRESKE